MSIGSSISGNIHRSFTFNSLNEKAIILLSNVGADPCIRVYKDFSYKEHIKTIEIDYETFRLMKEWFKSLPDE